MRALFDHYVIVDWSAANRPRQGRDSIWICHRGPHGERSENPATRHLARVRLANLLASILADGGSALVGFDFPFGYPAGFSKRLGLPGLPWKATWNEIARLMDDNQKNESNRFKVAAMFNQRASDGLFPFWGCPAKQAGQFLGSRNHRLDEPDGLREQRLIDVRMVGAQPCWKLLGTGSVGSQVLTGIPVVHALRGDERLREHCRIWPFETGLRAPDAAQVVFAEVWPSWWPDWKKTQEPGEVNDKAQVRHVAQVFAAKDRVGELARWFAGDPDLSDEQRHIIEAEEAWTLGVTAPRPRSSLARPRKSRRGQFQPSPASGGGQGGG
jgi:precorrin-8X/cobalt-precorrin-8 methylmutase